jgi:hypothetical protein
MAVPPHDVVRVAAVLDELLEVLRAHATQHIRVRRSEDKRGTLALEPILALEVPKEVAEVNLHCIARRGGRLGWPWSMARLPRT